MRKLGYTNEDIKPLTKKDIRNIGKNIPDTFKEHAEIYSQIKIQRYNRRREEKLRIINEKRMEIASYMDKKTLQRHKTLS
jgi:hypothetical protein